MKQVMDMILYKMEGCDKGSSQMFSDELLENEKKLKSFEFG